MVVLAEVAVVAAGFSPSISLSAAEAMAIPVPARFTIRRSWAGVTSAVATNSFTVDFKVADKSDAAAIAVTVDNVGKSAVAATVA